MQVRTTTDTRCQDMTAYIGLEAAITFVALNPERKMRLKFETFRIDRQKDRRHLGVGGWHMKFEGTCLICVAYSSNRRL